MGLLPFTHYDSWRDIDHISKFQSIKQKEPITIQTIWLMSWYWSCQQVKINRTKWGYYLLHSVTEGVIFIISTNENLSNNTGLSPFIIIILCLFFVLDIENVKLSPPSHHKLDSVWQRILKQNFICHIKSAFAVVFLLCCFLVQEYLLDICIYFATDPGAQIVHQCKRESIYHTLWDASLQRLLYLIWKPC